MPQNLGGVLPLLWIVSRVYFDHLTKSDDSRLVAAQELSLAQAQRVLARGWNFVRDEEDRAAYDYLRDLWEYAGFRGTPTPIRNVPMQVTLFVLPKVRDPQFPDIPRDYRIYYVPAQTQ